jgi:hypothetical protein
VAEPGACHEAAAASVLDGAMPVPTGTARTLPITTTSGPVRIAAPAGGAEITELVLDVDRVDADAMRRTILVGTFDGDRTIEAPLGDFFAFEPDGIDVVALPVSSSHDGHFVLRFPMRYLAEAAFELVDAGAGPLGASLTVTQRARPFDSSAMYFHATWTGIEEIDVYEPGIFRVADLVGEGLYVGTVLHVSNPSTRWWGEGDEQIWIDGESFPSHFGTGTEDYFGYAFCTTGTFSHPYFGETRANPTDFAGFVSLYRFHVVDPIPFTESLVFDLEALHWQTGIASVTVAYDAVYYFYAKPGVVRNGRILVPADYTHPVLPPGTVVVGNGSHRC